MDRDGPYRHAPWHELAGVAGSGSLQARCSRRRSLRISRAQRLADQILWHDGLGMSLYAKRLERGRFIWPQATDGVISISMSQLAYMLDGIDWRNPVQTWRPSTAG